MLKFQILQYNVERKYKKRENDSQENILESKLILLDTEVSEFMNELEDHKYYKMNKKQNKNKQLEEFCDCIHAVYSIANSLEIKLDCNYDEIYKADDILKKYRSLKLSISRFSATRALNSKVYSENYLRLILHKLYSIAKAKDFTEEDIVIAFVAVYTKNMIRATSDY